MSLTNASFPVFKTKSAKGSPSFRLEDPAARREYFDFKAGEEIKNIRSYLLAKNTFVGFLLGKKNSGKGTYSKLFIEALGSDRVAHISVGDSVRNARKCLDIPAEKEALVEFLKSQYRGFISVEEALHVIAGHDTKTLLPTEVILSLVEFEICRLDRKALFIDGFPRDLDQISLSLYFRALMKYRDDPDFFVFINIPNAIINERMKNRVICPLCQTPRSPKLLRTKEVGFDEKTEEFYLMCDTPSCQGARMISKEGDALGIEAIRSRVETDEKIMETLLSLQGVPKIYLRNSVPVAVAKESVDPYEVTPSYRYELDEKKSIKVIEEPWIINDDEGVPSYSLLPSAVVVSLIKQTAKALNL